jgi:hypothetical protein
VISNAQDLQRWLCSWGAGLQIEGPAGLQGERLRWLAAQQPANPEQYCAQVQLSALADPAARQSKRQRIRKRIGPPVPNHCRQQWATGAALSPAVSCCGINRSACLIHVH